MKVKSHCHCVSRTATDTLDVSKASMPVVSEAPMSPVMTDMPATSGKGKDPGIKEVCGSSTTMCLVTAAASAGLQNKPVTENPERILTKF